LIVEDDFDLREALVELLQEAGFSVRGAENGSTALDMLVSMRPRLVLADLTMPGLDGRSLMREAHARMDVAPAFVFVTGAPPSAIGDLRDRVISKPVDIDQLMTVVRRHCSQGRRRS
jgi:DNA-binding response OmpR family regulator